MSIVEEGLTGPSVFLDETKLSFDFVPDELPHREDELRRLAMLYRGVAGGTLSQHALLRGPVGSGKTALALRFARDLRDAMRKNGRILEHAYVNCRNDRTDALALVRILKKLDKGFPERGFSSAEMLDSLRKDIQRKECHMLIILDEVDVLLKDGTSDLLYNLTRFGGDRPMVSVLAVSQHDVFAMLDEATASTFPRTNQIELARYSFEALCAIVNQRVRLAFHAGVIAEEVAELVADIAAAQGDARRAIEILRFAGTNANDEGREEVGAEDVRAAKANIHSELPESKLRELPLHEALVLLAIARNLARTGAAYGTTGEVEDAYKRVAEGYEESPRGHTQFWQYLRNLASYGFITLRKSGRGHAGTTQLISLPDVPAAKFGKRLEQLLAEVHDRAV